ncbi:glycosyltransferase family 4 protein [Tessaracoccus sp. G1721]
MSAKLSRLLVLGDPQPGAAELAPPFGVLELQRHGFEVVNPRRRAAGLLRKVRDLIEHRTNILVEDTVRGLAVRAEWVLALLDNNANLVLRLKKWGVPPYRTRRLAVLVCWATERLLRMTASERRQHVDLLNAADVLFVLSRNQIPILERFGVEPGKTHFIPLGVETAYFSAGATPCEERRGVVAIGQDEGRDYRTMFAALVGTTVQVDLFCAEWNLEGLDLPAQVTWRGTVPRGEYRDILQRSRAVIVPTKEFAYPTGQSVALEASAAGALVLTTATAPLKEYFEDGITALLSDPLDPDGLRRNLLMLEDEPRCREIAMRGQERCLERFTPQAMWGEAARHLGR